MSGAYLLLVSYSREESQVSGVDASWNDGVLQTILFIVILTLTSNFVFESL